MWGYLYPGTDATGTLRGLATPTPLQANVAWMTCLGVSNPIFNIGVAKESQPLGEKILEPVGRFRVGDRVVKIGDRAPMVGKLTLPPPKGGGFLRSPQTDS